MHKAPELPARELVTRSAGALKAWLPAAHVKKTTIALRIASVGSRLRSLKYDKVIVSLVPAAAGKQDGSPVQCQGRMSKSVK